MQVKKERKDETRIMNCGMFATIIDYVNAHNITVQFSDGTIVGPRSYDSFKKGFIKHPKIKNTYAQNKRAESEKKWLGAVRHTNKGEKITLVKYINCKNVIAQFEDGTQVYTTAFNFDNGAVGYPKPTAYS